MTDFPSKLRVYDLVSEEFIVEASVSDAISDPDFPDIDETRYEVSWLTNWIDSAENRLWEGDVVKRVRDTCAEYQRIDYEKNGTPVDDASPEDLINDRSGSVAIVTWKDNNFTFDQLFGHKWAFIGPEGSLNVNMGLEVRRIGTIHDNDINNTIKRHSNEES